MYEIFLVPWTPYTKPILQAFIILSVCLLGFGLGAKLVELLFGGSEPKGWRATAIADLQRRLESAEAQGKELEAKMIEVDIRQLRFDAAFERSYRVDQLVLAGTVIGGVTGIAGPILFRDSLASVLNSYSHEWVAVIFVHDAFASTQLKNDLTSVAPYLLGFILLIVAVAFLSAVYIALTMPKKRENIDRRKTADNIIKMSGAFLGGFAMALIK